MILPPDRRRAFTQKAQSFAGSVEQVLPYLLSRGITAEVAAMFTLGAVPAGGEFAGRLSIPYITPAGVVQIKYRCADLSHHDGFKHTADKCPKYLYEAGTGTHLYNAQVLIHAATQVAVTEGELDAVCIQAYTGIPAVAYPGVDTWGKHRHYRLCFEGVSEVVVVADGDQTGRESARRVAESIGMNARVVDMPSGHDSNSFIASQGAGAFTERFAG
jgi:DNA primase